MTARDEAGFTLLEVTVSLVVLGLIMAGLTGGLRFGLEAWRRQAAGAADGDPAAADAAIRGLIERMDAGDRMAGETITGSAGRLDFITRLPSIGGEVPGQRVAARIERDGGRLVLRWSPRLHAESSVPVAVATTVLLDGISGLSLSYLDGNGWVGVWDRASPPRLVRLRVGRANGAPWPDIVASPVRN